MLSGQELRSAGEDVSETLAAILKDQPAWGTLPETLPSTAQALLRRCLRKDQNRRLHDIADARIEIEEALNSPVSASENVAPTATPRLLLAVAGGAALGAVAVWLALGLFGEGGNGPPTSPVPLQYMLPDDQRLSSPAYTNTLAITPDGSMMFYPATLEGTESPQLLWRMMDGSESGVVPDSEEAVSPFLDPSGEWLGFIVGVEILKWRIGSLRAERIGAVPGLRRLAWGPTGTIIVGHDSAGLLTISDDGREPAVPLTVLNTERGDIGHRNPSFLPDGRVLFNIHDTGDMSFMLIAVTSLDDGAIEVLDIQGANPRFVSTGHLLFNRFPDIWAVPFDPQTTTLLGAPVAVLLDVSQDNGRPNPKFDVSGSGIAVYQPMVGGARSELAWVDVDGNVTPVGIPPGRPYFNSPRISPDGQSIVANSAGPWIWDGARGHQFDTDGQLSFLEWAGNEDFYYAGYWTAARGGSDLLIQGRFKEETVFLRANSASADEWNTGPNPSPVDLSTDGEWLLFHNRTNRENGDRSEDLWVVDSGTVKRNVFAPGLYWLGRPFFAALDRLGLVFNWDPEADAGPPQDYPCRYASTQAAVGVRQLDALRRNLAHRRLIASWLEEQLGWYGASLIGDFDDQAWLRYSFLVEDRAEFEQRFRSRFDLGIWFPVPIFGARGDGREVGYEPGCCPVAEGVARHIVNLPTHPRIRPGDLQAVFRRHEDWIRTQIVTPEALLSRVSVPPEVPREETKPDDTE